MKIQGPATPVTPESLSESRLQRLAIDRAARWPVGVFIGSSIFWLVIGSLFAIAASIKLHDPEFVADHPWLTFGRVRTAHLNAVAYGWLSTAGIGIGLWILSRLCRVPIEDHRSLTLSAILWNFGNAVGLWFTPIGLAAAYYLIPKIIGKPIHSYYLSAIGFWSLAFFYAWNGMHHLIGGPFPAFLVTASVVASVMMVIPVITVAINHHMTMKGNFAALRYSPTLRFVVFGAMAYTLVSIQGSTRAIREINQVSHFTHYTVAHAHLGAYGFASMVYFGTIYYIMPRLLNVEWPSRLLIRIHFWACAIGMAIYFVGLSIGGWLQGMALNRSDTPFMEIMAATIPYLKVRTVGGSLMTLGHVALAISFLWMLFKRRDSAAKTEPTLFAPASPENSVSRTASTSSSLAPCSPGSRRWRGWSCCRCGNSEISSP